MTYHEEKAGNLFGGEWSRCYRRNTGMSYNMEVFTDGRRYTYGISSTEDAGMMQKNPENNGWFDISQERQVFHTSGALLAFLNDVVTRPCGLPQERKLECIKHIGEELR